MRDPRVSPLNPYANFNFDPSTSTQTNSTANHLLGDPVQDRIYSKMNSQHLQLMVLVLLKLFINLKEMKLS
jgi:hypothetical protein